MNEEENKIIKKKNDEKFFVQSLKPKPSETLDFFEAKTFQRQNIRCAENRQLMYITIAF
jgi:hypothetical protein